MSNETIDLLKLRAISFFWELLSILSTAIAGYLLSDEFKALVTEHFGIGIAASIIFLITAEGAKHLRNLKVRNEMRLGARATRDTLYI